MTGLPWIRKGMLKWTAQQKMPDRLACKICNLGDACCHSAPDGSNGIGRAAHLDLQPDPAASAAILIDDDLQVCGWVTLHSPVAHVDSAARHRRHLGECQRLHVSELSLEQCR